MPVGFFFEDMSEEIAARSPGRAQGDVEPVEDDRNPVAKRETLELVRAYYKIHNPAVRKRLFEMAKALAAGEA